MKRSYVVDHSVPVSRDLEITAIADRVAGVSGLGPASARLEETFWAKRFGALVDQFDIPWMINYQGNVEVPMPGNTGTEKESA